MAKCLADFLSRLKEKKLKFSLGAEVLMGVETSRMVLWGRWISGKGDQLHCK